MHFEVINSFNVASDRKKKKKKGNCLKKQRKGGKKGGCYGNCKYFPSPRGSEQNRKQKRMIPFYQREHFV